jgi:hypothetical protein
MPMQPEPTIVGLNHVQLEALPGWQRCYIADPWGNRLELLERLDAPIAPADLQSA